jgi:hypothetical protein
MSARYRLTRRLATGIRAEVFVGVAIGEAEFEKPVAVKRLLPHLMVDEGMVQAFVAEARLARHLQHQNIVSVLDVGRGAQGLFLVMELVDGWDLGTVLRAASTKGQGVPAQLRAWVLAQVNAAVMHAQGKQVDPRRPGTVLLSREGEVKVSGAQVPLGALVGELWAASAEVPVSLAPVLGRMLAADPAARPSGPELSRELGAYLASCGEAAGPHELAAFLAGLPLPPSPLQLPEDPALTAATAGGGTAEGPWFELDAEPWAPRAGPALDASGRLDRFGALGPADPAPVPAPVQRSFSENDAPLELARDLRREESPSAAPRSDYSFDLPPRRRSVLGPLVALVVVAGLAGAGWLFWPQLRRLADEHAPGVLPARRTHVLSIESVPEGATVLINGREVGTTPVLMENDYPPRDIPLELRLPGHAPWKGSFRGGDEARVSVRLEPRKGGRR